MGETANSSDHQAIGSLFGGISFNWDLKILVCQVTWVCAPPPPTTSGKRCYYAHILAPHVQSLHQLSFHQYLNRDEKALSQPKYLLVPQGAEHGYLGQVNMLDSNSPCI